MNQQEIDEFLEENRRHEDCLKRQQKQERLMTYCALIVAVTVVAVTVFIMVLTQQWMLIMVLTQQ
jgi:cytoskeletal protein RodZ